MHKTWIISFLTIKGKKAKYHNIHEQKLPLLDNDQCYDLLVIRKYLRVLISLPVYQMLETGIGDVDYKLYIVLKPSHPYSFSFSQICHNLKNKNVCNDIDKLEFITSALYNILWKINPDSGIIEVESISKQSLKKQPLWICYICNLTFKDEIFANLHKNISNHQARLLD